MSSLNAMFFMDFSRARLYVRSDSELSAARSSAYPSALNLRLRHTTLMQLALNEAITRCTASSLSLNLLT